MGDYDARLVSPLRFSNEELEKIHADLKLKSRSDEFFAYLSAALTCFYPYNLKDKEDPAELLKIFPDSLLIKYKTATCLYPNEDLLREIVGKDPGFFEAYYHLGEAALDQGQLVTAEENYLKAWAGIPETPQIPIALASIYFAMEDLERSIEFYDKTLEILPGYREAMLGKAIGLSYLGRSNDAMIILEKLIGLGFMLMGESHFWMSWNLQGFNRTKRPPISGVQRPAPHQQRSLLVGGDDRSRAGRDGKSGKKFPGSLDLQQEQHRSAFLARNARREKGRMVEFRSLL